MKSEYKYIVGIDESGRGPLAGPLAMGMVAIPFSLDLEAFGGATDSKLHSPKEREEWFSRLEEHPHIIHRVTFVSHESIDKRGLTWASRISIKRLLKEIDHTNSILFLDGLLHAPSRFKYHQTIIGGDKKIKVISLASIVAKVMRDRRMVRYAKRYPHYGFEHHKGYGTREHKKRILEYGMTPIHRRTFVHIFS